MTIFGRLVAGYKHQVQLKQEYYQCDVVVYEPARCYHRACVSMHAGGYRKRRMTFAPQFEAAHESRTGGAGDQLTWQAIWSMNEDGVNSTGWCWLRDKGHPKYILALKPPVTNFNIIHRVHFGLDDFVPVLVQLSSD